MLKNILKKSAVVSISIALGVCTCVESQAATVKENLNLREGASTKHNIKRVLDKGESIKVISELNGWYKIKTSDNKTGWSHGKYIDASQKEKEQAGAIKGIVTHYLNFRKGPSIEDEIINVHERGEKVKVLQQKNDWCKVETLDGKEGWSYKKYIKILDDNLQWEYIDENATLKNNANMRKGASTNYQIIEVLSKGENVKVVSSLNGWYKIQTLDGKKGWVHSSHINTDFDLITGNKTSTSSTSKNSKKSSQSQSSYSSKKEMVVSATAYSSGTITATGTKPRWGTIAVDPRVIPYGTKVYIPKFNKVFIAEDCGGGIKGNKIDIFMNSKSQCYNWGVRNISIQILD